MIDKVKALIEWLDGREWDTTKINRSISRYEREVEKARVKAVQSLLLDLHGYVQEAIAVAEDEAISARDRQHARTEVRVLRTNMEELEKTLTSGQMPLYFEGKK